MAADTSGIQDILTYWFEGPKANPKWFQKSDQTDNEIREKFSGLVTQAGARTLETWTSSPDGTLALLILLDQFPRNLFRGSGESYSSDAQARDVAAVGVAKGFDHQVPYIRQPFFYLPFMHDEHLLGQIAAKAFYAEYGRRCEADEDAIRFARISGEMTQKHMDVILRFGRFPARNEPMGRESTEEEKEFLKENPGGF